jgi:hypothetical protein
MHELDGIAWPFGEQALTWNRLQLEGLHLGRIGQGATLCCKDQTRTNIGDKNDIVTHRTHSKHQGKVGVRQFVYFIGITSHEKERTGSSFQERRKTRPKKRSHEKS